MQRAIDQAQFGDRIILEAGASYDGPITLPAKPAVAAEDSSPSAWISIESSALERLPINQRLAPDQTSLLPKILSSGKEPALRTQPAAHHYRFIGIEFSPPEGQAQTGSLIVLGSATQKSLAEVPHHLSFDRCFIHASADLPAKRGIALNSAETTISNSRISGFKLKGQDSQAICGWNGPGPFRIVNNYLEGAGETVMFGGSDATISGLVPSDIELRGNHITKDVGWRGVWTVKNLVELKSARRVLIEGNLIEYSWRSAQGGYAFVFSTRNQDGGAPWSQVADVVVRNNLIRHVASGISTLGRDYNHPSEVTTNLRIENNLFLDVSKSVWGDGYGGVFFKNQGTQQVAIVHNTVQHSDHVMVLDGEASLGGEIRDNIWAHNYYGIWGTKTGTGGGALGQYFPEVKFQNNVLAGARNAKSGYPEGNYYPASLIEVRFADPASSKYWLAADSTYKGTGSDGSDVGVNFSLLSKQLNAEDLIASDMPTHTPPVVSLAPEITSEQGTESDAPTLLTDGTATRALVLDPLTFVRDPFPFTTGRSLSGDEKTRIMLFASNIEFQPDEATPVIIAHAEDAQERIHQLTVESIAVVPNQTWLKQLVIVLPEDLKGAGNFWVTITINNLESNKVLINAFSGAA